MSVSEEAVIHTRLTGAAQVTAGLAAERGETDALTVSTERAGLAMERTAKRSFLMNQTLFTMRRFLYMGTLALTAFTALSLKWGWTFNSQMQQGRIALKSFLGTNEAVNKELSSMYNLAAYTPFQFKDIVQAGETMYAFGFNTQMVNTTLANLTDALVATGKATPAGLNRISTALGHMMSIGHATGQVLLQLARDGIPGVYESIKKHFGLTGKQMEHIGSLRIPANMVIDAINQGIAGSALHGLARRQAEGSLHGLATTARDFISRIFGDLERRPFSSLQRMIKRLNPILNAMGQGFERNGFKGMFDAMGNSQTASHIRLWVNTLTQLWHVFSEGLIPAIKVWLQILQPVTSGLLLLSGILGIVTGHSTILKWVLVALIGQFIILRIQAYYLAAAERAAALAEWFHKTVALDLMIATRLVTAATWIYTGALWLLYAAQFQVAEGAIFARTVTWLWTAAVYAAYTAQGILAAAIFIARDAIMTSVFWTRITTAADWLWVTALYAVSAAQGILNGLLAVFTSEAIGANVAATSLLGTLGLLSGIGVIVIGVDLVFTKQGRKMLTSHFDVVPRTGIGFLDKSFQFVGLQKPKKHPGMAGGGYVEQAGWAWVGERGPELRWNPPGATVLPLQQARPIMPDWMSNSEGRPIVVKLEVDGRTLAEIVAKHESDAGARA